MKMLLCSVGVAAALLALASAPAAAQSVCVEAESAAIVTPPMLVSSNAADAAVKSASGGRCLDVPQGVGKPPDVGGEAVLALRVAAAGEYVLWARVWWLDSCGNSLTLVLDGGRPFAFGQDATYTSWHWVRGMKVTLAAGAHELRIQNREDGVKVDQVLLTRDADYVPVGAEEATAAP